ncbi:tyrosine-type recombinase/integrase [Rhodococcus daqingensis]|uniref:Tyrosine-type recombinase/integrase n=1 Tax=Rhodococcus daqingensis TaxID=2479363 RepID=A0ABW2S435_9NOCA
MARYVGADGKERSKTFELEKLAKAWVADREKEVREGDWIDPTSQETTVGQLWHAWTAAAHTDGTRKVRELVGRNLGDLEGIAIGRLRTSHIRAWTHTLSAGRTWLPGCEGLGENTVKNFAGQLAGCLTMAVDDGLLRKSPYASLKGKKRRTHKAVTTAELISADDVWTLAEAARAGARKGTTRWVREQRTLARMIIVGAALGVRAGEIAGLRIRSVDFLRREASITEQSKTGTAAFEWAPLKTPAAERVLPLPQVALDALAEELAENPCADRSLPIFRTMSGRMWSSSTLGKSFRAVRKRCGLDDVVTWHSLRHFYASTLIHSGASVKTVQERLGHAKAATTLEIYTHLWPGEDERTRSAMDKMLNRDRAGTAVAEGAEGPGGASQPARRGSLG